MSRILIYSRYSDGHRNEYNDVLLTEFKRLGASPVVVHRFTFDFLRSDVYFPMIDDNVPLFLICALTRLVIRYKLSGLFFRPAECFRRNHFKYLAKYHLFGALRHLPRVRIFTIVPFIVDPRFSKIANGGLYDLQLWDGAVLPIAGPVATTPLSNTLLEAAAGRQIIVALGGQNRIKGFDQFADLWCSHPELHHSYLFVAAGKISDDFKHLGPQIADAGGKVIDRFISSAELHSLYMIANAVWAAYAPDYDQASGIAGRSFQYGVPTILREGAAMTKVFAALKGSYVVMPWDAPERFAADLLKNGLPARRDSPKREIDEMRGLFAEALRSTLTDI